MTNMNNTNPDSPPKGRYKPKKVDWGWRDDVVKELKVLGVPHAHAEVAMIDNREPFDKCAGNKLTAKQTADMLISLVEQYYNKGQHYV